MRVMRSLQLFLPITFIILLVDVLSKRLVYECFAIRGFDRIPVFQDVFGVDGYITYLENRGGAWGVFSDYHQYLLMFRICVITILFLYLLFAQTHILRNVSLTLIVSGAIGNVLDSAIYGHVVDMLQLVLWGYHFPVFNFADISIFFGSIGLFIHLIFGREADELYMPEKHKIE